MRAVLSALAVFALTGAAHASNIPITNPSFESPVTFNAQCNATGKCPYESGSIPGWRIFDNGVAGVISFQTGSNTISPTPDGTQSAWANDTAIIQTLTTKVVAGKTYTFSVDVGNRADCCAFSSVPVIDVGFVDYTATGTQPAPGQWSLYTVTFYGTNDNAGDTMSIFLNSPTAQGEFDDVTLTAVNTTPEPSSLILLGTGILSLAGALRRR